MKVVTSVINCGIEAIKFSVQFKWKFHLFNQDTLITSLCK